MIFLPVPRRIPASRLLVCTLALVAGAIAAPSVSAAEDKLPFAQLQTEYHDGVLPLLKQYCNDCHATEVKEGELDLERFAEFAHVRQDPKPWQKVIEMLDNGEMPPADSPQMSGEEQKQLRAWVQHYLDTEARANAGDPGPVVLRRLNNAEYTYTIQDLTGLGLNPAEQFPVDGAAGEGFTNTGNSLVMSPSLVTKYLDAAKKIAEHIVLLPDGIEFSEGSSRRDFTDEIVAEIQKIYTRHTGPLADASALDRWNVADTLSVTKDDGRIDLARYVSVLLEHRDEVANGTVSYEEVAAKKEVNAKYLRLLGTALNHPEDGSILLNQLRARWHSIEPEEADSFIAEIRAWQQQLWKYNTVGQFGSIRKWQEGVDPISTSREFRQTITAEGDANEISIFLQANGAGQNTEKTVVRWHQPRFVRPGQSPLLLRDLRAISILFPELRAETFARTTDYLAAVRAFRDSGKTADVNQLATEYDVDPETLTAWLELVGLQGSVIAAEDHLYVPYQDPKREAVKGWVVPDAPALMIVSNPTDQEQHIPGAMPPHSIAVHPRPERWVAAGWESPFQGKVRVEADISDADLGCGNGITWSLERQRGVQREVLQTAHISGTNPAKVTPVEGLDVLPGDLVSIVIRPRDGSHACDLTLIELKIAEEGNAERRWSLTNDCAATIQANNPHPDQHGNAKIWHFYTGFIAADQAGDHHIPRGSVLANWSISEDEAVTKQLAADVQQLLTKGPTSETAEADRILYERLQNFSGLLFSRLDYSKLANQFPAERLSESTMGVDSMHLPEGVREVTAEGDLLIAAPARIELTLPVGLVNGAEFLTTATVASGSAQVDVNRTAGPDWERLQAGLPILTPEGDAAQEKWRTSLHEFRQLFPLAMCYPKIVPTDEGISIVLFHREDEHLERLMLSEEEAARLDRLWTNLRYVSQDALTSIVVLEQLIQFATQDGEPTLYEPLREPYNKRADQYRQWLLDTESVHVEALVDFTRRAYRRPLTEGDAQSIRSLYAALREQDLSHEEAFQLTFARVLTSPAFLYRLEEPGGGTEPTPVSDWELATRLSYFLWSSTPDAELLSLSAQNQLHEPTVLASQTKRMLADPKMRRMAIEFGCQWLHIRDFDQHDEKSETVFPEFAELRGDMYEESILFLQDMLQRDGSILDLIDADHTFLNERLAAFYGIPNVEGEEWRRVEGVRQYRRGGILTQATTLSKQSGASRTSAILRGNWIYESLLGERLPRPPKDVPILPETVPAGLTERQLIEQHSSVESCAKCHVRIDPFGFSLEGFDAIGRVRETDAGGNEIDTLTELKDGTEIAGLPGLQKYLGETRRETFVRQFCQKLLGYALGRSVQLSDEPLLDEMMTKLSENDYRITVAIETIVNSEQFRNVRGRDFTSALEVSETP
ncbi:MAG: hypothetical protein CMJ46_04870 [Planctomyces sp.]|nr:hypothetical protein [Planctomyces sp.]